MKVYTIGFTKKSAEEFFALLRGSGARRLIDVRLNSTSQLSRFAHGEDLTYLLKELCGMEYIDRPDLAPTKKILDSYRKEHRDWETYEREFLALMDERRIAEEMTREEIAGACLLCSEHEPEHCHRRLVAEHLNRQWGNIEITHLT